MPHPQDVAVPSLPLSETLALAIKLGVANVDFEEQAEIDGFLHTFGNACYEAGRAAGRASAEPEGAQAEPVADARRFVYDEHVRPLRSGDDESFPGLSWYDFGSSRMHPCVINARGRTVLRDGDWIVLIGTQYHAFTPEVYALLAAPTPTASIAPKAEGRDFPMLRFPELYGVPPKADPLSASVESRLAECASKPFESEGNRRVAPKAEGEADESFVSRWTRVIRDMPSTYEHPAAPVAQAAAGASDDVLAKLRWVDHVLGEVRQQVAAIESLSYGRACDKLKEVIAALSPLPEADADRASGGGV